MTMARPAAGANPATEIEHAEWVRLQQRLRGSVVLPEDDGYDEARRVWNAMVDKRPVVIVFCTTPDDVVEAIGPSAGCSCARWACSPACRGRS